MFLMIPVCAGVNGICVSNWIVNVCDEASLHLNILVHSWGGGQCFVFLVIFVSCMMAI